MVDFFVHESSYVDEGAIIGKDTKIWHFSHVMAGAVIGENCNLGQNVVISPGVVLGKGVRVQNNVSVYTGVICKDYSFLGPSCVFTNVINPRSFIERKDEYRETIVGYGASIGANSTIICGNSIGDYAMIGAGSVVTKDVQPHQIIVGNPGRCIGYICECGERLVQKNETEYECTACGKNYTKTGERIELKEQE